MTPVRVLAVSADPWARAGLAALLGGEGLEVVGQTEGSVDADLRPDVAVVDWRGDPSVREELEALVQAGVPALVLLGEGAEAAGLLRLGAKGVVARDAEPEALAAAVAAVARGLVVLEPEVFDQLTPPEPEGQEPPELSEPLTARELEVLHLLASGLSNRLIAERLSLSEHTAKFHVAQILAKLGVESRTEAVVRAARLGLVLL